MCRHLLVSFTCLFLAGCLDYEKQTLVLKISPDGKQAKLLLIYEGLRVGGEAHKTTTLDNAKGELEALVRDRQHFYLLNSWPLRVVLAEADSDSDEIKARKARFRKLLTIENGAFFTDAAGKVGFWHTIHTQDLPSLVAAINDVLVEELARYTEEQLANPLDQRKGRIDLPDDESLRRWKPFLATKPKLLTWQNGVWRYELPCTRWTADMLKQESETALGQNRGAMPEALHFATSDQGLVVTLGRKGELTLRINTREPNVREIHEHDRELWKFARTLPLPFKAGVTAEAVVADFMKAKS